MQHQESDMKVEVRTASDDDLFPHLTDIPHRRRVEELRGALKEHGREMRRLEKIIKNHFRVEE